MTLAIVGVVGATLAIVAISFGAWAKAVAMRALDIEERRLADDLEAKNARSIESLESTIADQAVAIATLRKGAAKTRDIAEGAAAKAMVSRRR